MSNKEDKRAITRWGKANIGYQNYLSYLSQKKNKFELTLIDLLYGSNFKGGNASICEDESSVNTKLLKYSEQLRNINKEFSNESLREINNNNLTLLKKMCDSFISLTTSNKIDGFQSSYASALLHLYFPNLIPILDRRVLNGANIKAETNSQGQVKNIEQYYSDLIEKYRDFLINHTDKTIRDFDYKCFVKPVKNKKSIR
jgi:t-SNARE complex subunit (syntaxin)